MKTILTSIVLSAFLLALISPVQLSAAQVPYTLSYQGAVLVDDEPFSGKGYFRFVMISAAGDSLWSHDGTSVNGSEPSSALNTSVHAGAYSFVLGGPSMQPLPPSVFESGQVWLRVWFSDGINGFELLTPDQLLMTVPYAMVAATVSENSVQTAQLGNGSVTGAKLAPDSVTGNHVKDGTLTGADMAPETVTSEQVDHTTELRVKSLKAVSAADDKVFANLYRLTVFGHGQSFDRGGRLELNNSEENLVAQLSATSGHGELQLKQTNGFTGVYLESHPTVGGRVLAYQNDGDPGIYLKGDSDGAGVVVVYNPTGNEGAILDGEGEHQSGELRLFDDSGDETVQIYGGRVSGTRGGGMELRNTSGGSGVNIYGEHLSGGGWITIYKTDGSAAITLDSEDSNGEGRITTQVLEITGGSDLSEQFDVSHGSGNLEPGTVVCIDPLNPGRLVPSTRAYDPTVAGIISGAGGVKPGLLMGQSGSLANGKHAVALTGRVYCQMDASHGAIQPGDLITTSDTPGHGMKAADHAKSQGAVVGKAMTRLESGQGLVLVLVSLQ